MENHQSLTCGFKENFTIKDAKNGEQIKISERHEYAIVGINKLHKYIRLIEPNKYIGRTSPTPINRNRIEPPPKEGGHIAMPFKCFEQNFRSINYTTDKEF